MLPYFISHLKIVRIAAEKQQTWGRAKSGFSSVNRNDVNINVSLKA